MLCNVITAHPGLQHTCTHIKTVL